MTVNATEPKAIGLSGPSRLGEDARHRRFEHDAKSVFFARRASVPNERSSVAWAGVLEWTDGRLRAYRLSNGQRGRCEGHSGRLWSASEAFLSSGAAHDEVMATRDRRYPDLRRLVGCVAGDIVLLYGDESEALTHPYLARAWAKSGADLRIPAPDKPGRRLRAPQALPGSASAPHASQPGRAGPRRWSSGKGARPSGFQV